MTAFDIGDLEADMFIEIPEGVHLQNLKLEHLDFKNTDQNENMD